MVLTKKCNSEQINSTFKSKERNIDTGLESCKAVVIGGCQVAYPHASTTHKTWPGLIVQ